MSVRSNIQNQVPKSDVEPKKFFYGKSILPANREVVVGVAIGAGLLGVFSMGCDRAIKPAIPSAEVSVNATDELNKPETIRLSMDILAVALEKLDMEAVVNLAQNGETVFSDTFSGENRIVYVTLDSLKTGYLDINASLKCYGEQFDSKDLSIMVNSGWNSVKSDTGSAGHVDTLNINDLETIILTINNVGLGESADSSFIDLTVRSLPTFDQSDTGFVVFEQNVSVGNLKQTGSLPIYGPDTQGSTWYFEYKSWGEIQLPEFEYNIFQGGN
ncbi:hypothetical protein KO465_02290 [Candidatus Micrarchaeota archaeon]|nr:hypothetical protein [Candidatus Micrarchaeota archaeon]